MKYLISELKYIANGLLKPLKKDISSIYNEVKHQGYAIIPDFISDEECRQLKEIFKANLHNDKVWRDPLGSDNRIYGIDHISTEYKSLFDKDWLKNIYYKYIDAFSFHHFIMANKVEYRDSNLGSGGGWHRDVINRRQLKFIVYLNDVSSNNGCFQYIPYSHKIKAKWKFNNLLDMPMSAVRYSQENIEKLLKNGYEIKNLEGSKGTLLIVDTSGVHRGRPIVDTNGYRFAITQYMSDVPFPKHVTNLLVNA